MNRPYRRRRIALVTTALLTLVIAALAMNFSTSEKHLERKVAHRHAISDPQFRREMSVLLGPSLLPGNEVIDYQNGDEIFPAMLAAIRGAQKTITLETYIYWSGTVGKEFSEALSERARAGVKVHLIIDWAGSYNMDEDLLKQMQAAGVNVQRYRPLHWYNLARLNNRTHRKLLVVDGRVGFTGGVGIASEWTGHAQDASHWRDTHLEMKGPAVAQMQSVFLDNWMKATGEVLHGDAYFPALVSEGSSRAQMFSSSPSGGSESMQLMYLMAITAAARSIDLSAAYFVPDELTVQALVAAMARGVKLRIIVPGPHIDSETVRSASRAGWGPLLAAGAVIAEYQPTMFHCKVLVVDGLLVSLGSTNFDNRSFRLNDEATLNILDADFAREQTRVFEDDLAKSRVVGLVEWLNRPMKERIAERLSRLIGSQL